MEGQKESVHTQKKQDKQKKKGVVYLFMYLFIYVFIYQALYREVYKNCTKLWPVDVIKTYKESVESAVRTFCNTVPRPVFRGDVGGILTIGVLWSSAQFEHTTDIPLSLVRLRSQMPEI